MLLLQVQQCDLVGLVDLNHEDDSVASRVAAYLNDLYARGVAGVRIDAAKHIRVSSLQSVFDKVGPLQSASQAAFVRTVGGVGGCFRA